MKKEDYGLAHTVHTYNMLIQAADIAGNYDKAMVTYEELLRSGVEPNNTPKELIENRFAPPLSRFRQDAMIRDFIIEPVSEEPEIIDSQWDLSHQLAFASQVIDEE